MMLRFRFAAPLAVLIFVCLRDVWQNNRFPEWLETETGKAAEAKGLVVSFAKQEERVNACQALKQKYPGEPFWKAQGKSEEEYPTKLHEPIIMKNVSGVSQDFAFCTIAKNGCSRWRRFFRKVVGVKDYMSYPHIYKDNGLQYPSHFPPTLFHRNNSTKDLLRAGLVRDPHARLLSAWFEKLNCKQEGSWGCPKLEPKEYCDDPNNLQNFTAFVGCLTSRLAHEEAACQWNEHLAPQHCMCHLSSMQYDMLLPVEEMANWFDPLIGCLGVSSFLANYSNGEAFGSELANQGGSAGTSAAKKLCDYYTPSTYDQVAQFVETDMVFSRWNINECTK